MAVLEGNELVLVQGVTDTGTPSGEQFQTTTQAIANLGGGSGGSGITNEVDVTTGTTGTATEVGTLLLFNSASFNSKIADIPASTGSLGIIIIIDVAGTAGTYPITINQAVSGLNTVYSNNGSLRLIDTKTYGWVSY